MREGISACIIACNEERKIRRCLDSVRWCDEIVVMDSYSTDRTVDICREYTARVVQQEWLGFVAQRNLIRERASQPWILFVDADEEISPELRNEILAEMNAGPGNIVGYEFPRIVYYLGRWIRHGEWYPDVKLRLFKKAYGRTEGVEPHDTVVVSGPVKRLRGPLWHYTYDDLSDHMRTINNFAGIGARQRFVRRPSFRWRDLLTRPFFRFFKSYVLKRGYRDGAHGFIIAGMSAVGAFVKYAKLWELCMRQKASFHELPEADAAADGRDGAKDNP